MKKEKYYENIREYIIEEQARTIVRDYSANRSKLETNYNIGKELAEAVKHYGEGIVKKYSEKLTYEFGKGFQYKELYKMQQFYLVCVKVGALHRQLTWNHYLKLLPLKDINEINYYIDISIRDNLSYRKLSDRIKSNEYNKLSLDTKIKLKEEKELTEKEMVPNTVIIPSNKSKEELNEKVLEELFITNITYIMKQLGDGYCYIDRQYKINIGNVKNYIDILLFNYKFNNFVVIELKAREFKKEDIGQIKLYMNYIDANLKTIYQNNTMGIIISKDINNFVVRYVKDDGIVISKYEIKELEKVEV